MKNIPSQARACGFTLVEAIVVIVITGIIAGTVAIFIRLPVKSSIDTQARAELADAADLALRRMSRELRLAVPNSVTVYNGGLAIQFLLTKTGGRYIDLSNNPPDTLKPLDFVGGSTVFDMVGTAPTGRQAIVPGDYIVIGNLGIMPANSYAFGAGADNISRVSAVNGSRITLQANNFSATQSPAFAFQVATGKVTYVCTPAAGGGGTLQRYFNATNLSAGMGALGSGAVLADKIAGCIFNSTVLPGQNAAGSLMTMVLSLEHGNGDRAQLVRQTQLDNPI